MKIYRLDIQIPILNDSLVMMTQYQTTSEYFSTRALAMKRYTKLEEASAVLGIDLTNFSMYNVNIVEIDVNEGKDEQEG